MPQPYQSGASEGFTFSREQAVEMNKEFSAAMIKAARRGLERPPRIGVFVDYTPMRPTHFAPESQLSLYGSSSRMCSDAAGAEEPRYP